jgi:hypothetical protein
MSNRRRIRPPRDEATAAILAATECEHCGSRKVLQKWRRDAWELIPLHRESCPTRVVNGRTASPHQVAESAVSAVRGQGHQVAYMRYDDDSGGVVVGQAASLS